MRQFSVFGRYIHHSPSWREYWEKGFHHTQCAVVVGLEQGLHVLVIYSSRQSDSSLNNSEELCGTLGPTRSCHEDPRVVYQNINSLGMLFVY